MNALDRVGALPELLSRSQWALVLILAGAILLVFPPDEPGLVLAAWFLSVLGASFLVVLLASWGWSLRRR